MRSSTFCQAGGQRLTPFSTVSPHGTSVFLAPKSSRSFQPALASLSSLRVWRLGPRDEPGVLPSFGVPGTFASSAGLKGAPGGPLVLSCGCRCHPCPLAVGQMGGPCNAPRSVLCRLERSRQIRIITILGRPPGITCTSQHIRYAGEIVILQQFSMEPTK